MPRPWRWRTKIPRNFTLQVNKLTEQGNKNTERLSCPRCGGSHSGQFCKFKSPKCYKCSEIGHLACVCSSKDEGKKGKVHSVQALASGNDEGQNDKELGIYSLHLHDQIMTNPNRYTVKMEIVSKPCLRELDTAADFSIMSQSKYVEKFANKPLTASKVILQTYTGEVLDVLGEMQCSIMYKGKQYYLPILVADYDANLP